jgi:hypothetical protein
MRHRLLFVPFALLTAAACVAIGAGLPSDGGFTSEFGISRSETLSSTGGNAYVSLTPGTFLRLEGHDDGRQVAIEITVLSSTRRVRFEAIDGPMSVLTRVVEEREWINGQMTQVSLNYYASCPRSANVYCFGEQATHFHNGRVVGHEGSWMAGKKGAKPGLLMPGSFLLGSRYYHELAPNVSMSRAENLRMGELVETAAGSFEYCVTTLETSAIEPDEEVLKVYAPGIGLIQDGELELVEFRN